MILTRSKDANNYSIENKMKIRKVKTSSLILGIVVELLFAVLMGYTAGAIGLGALYPPALQLVTKPFVCANGEMTYTQQQSQIGSETYTSVLFFCTEEDTGIKTELDLDTVTLYGTPFYSLLFFVIFLALTYVYWYSSVGPAKNDGLHLW